MMVNTMLIKMKLPLNSRNTQFLPIDVVKIMGKSPSITSSPPKLPAFISLGSSLDFKWMTLSKFRLNKPSAVTANNIISISFDGNKNEE